MALLSSCKINKYLDENTVLLRRNHLKFEDPKAVPQRDQFAADISKLYRQEGISKFNAWRYYYLSKPRKDTSALIKYLLKRSVVPHEFSVKETEQTTRSIKNYMVQRGYFEAETDYSFEVKGRWVEVTYYITPNQRYLVDTLEYISQDSAIKSILDASVRESHLRRDQAVDQKLYELEVNRITNLLQNQGYANFFSNYIAPLKGDSLNGRVKIQLEVLRQKGDQNHTRYRVGQINVYSNVAPDFPNEKLFKTTYKNIDYYSENGFYFIKPKALHHHIFLHPDSIYARSNYDKTLQRIGRMPAVRFVTLRPVSSSIDQDVLNYNLHITPSQKIGIDGNVDLNNSNISIINQRFLGIAGRIGIRHKNLYGGAEQNMFNISGGVELNTLRDSLRTNSNYFFRLENTLQLPKFFDIPGVYRWLSFIKIGNFNLLRPQFYRLMKEDATSRFTFNGDFVIQRLFYSYNSFNFTYGFDLMQDNRRRYVLNQTGINYFTPSFTDQFVERILRNNEFLRRSLVKQFFTGFLFRDLLFSYTSIPNRARETYQMFASVELSGAEFTLLGWALNRPLKELGDIELSKYARVDLDARYTRVYNDKHSAATRINVGVALPYDTSQEVPFVKQFFVGGGLSIRAWQMRALGPGSYKDTTVQTSPLDLFQTGDFKFEINGEYRYRLYGIFETAFFLDIGNVWLLKEDPQRPNARLDMRRFLKDLAIGSGIGFRLVFDFFIVRLDWGVKVKNPYPINNSYWARGNFREMTNLNLAISYPF